MAKEKHLAAAAKKKNILQADKKAKEEEEELSKRNQKEKDEQDQARSAREAYMNDVDSVGQSIDLDGQHRIMSGMNEYGDKYNDFGF